MRQVRKGRRLSKMNMTILLITAIVLLCGITVYAKYYAQSAQKGIAIASGAYLTANYAAAAVPDSTDFVESIIQYTGGSTTFDFEVRNYENNLLFNSSGINVTYRVSFWLGRAPENAVYRVSAGSSSSEVKALQVGENNKVVFDNQSLPGGTTNKNAYTISIDVTGEGLNHNPVPVYAVVETLDTSMVQKTLKGKMTLSQATLPEKFIEASEFLVPAEVRNGTDAEKLAALEKLSGLTYEIRTVGSILASEEVTEEIKLSWRGDMLEIDRNNSNYLTWVEANSTGAPASENIEGITWKYITMHIMPYSSEQIIFYRTGEFEEHKPVTMNETNGLNTFVKAEKYVVTPSNE